MNRSVSFVVIAFCVLLASVVPSAAHAQAAPAAPPAPPSLEDTERALMKVEAVPQLLAIGQRFMAQNDWERYAMTMQRILQLRPHAGNIRLELAAAYAMQDKKTEAYDGLVRLQSTGYVFDIADDRRFENLHGTELWDYLVTNFKANRIAFGEGKVAYTLPKDDLLIEALAYDANASRFLAGSVRNGTIYAIGAKGALTPLIKPDATNGLWGVFDMTADAARDTLWVASSALVAVKHAKAIDYGRAGVFAFSLSTGKFKAKYLPAADNKQHVFSSITINPKGDVYVGDSNTRQVFKVEGNGLRVVVQHPKLASIRGVAASGDNKLLYLADNEMGLFGLDLTTGNAFDLRVPQMLTLFGIESVYWYDGYLVIVQNSFEPKRVMRLQLSKDGRDIVGSQALDAGQAAFGMPVRGTIAGDKFYFVANSQKAQYDAYGLVKDKSKLEGARVFASDLKFALE
jgi:hypothetical protein